MQITPSVCVLKLTHKRLNHVIQENTQFQEYKDQLHPKEFEIHQFSPSHCHGARGAIIR